MSEKSELQSLAFKGDDKMDSGKFSEIFCHSELGLLVGFTEKMTRSTVGNF